jgi:lipopolysaccharide transport system ATP-binding protein
MSNTVIEVRDVSKRYRLGTDNLPYRTIREAVLGWIGRSSSGETEMRDVWALRGVDLAIDEGSVVGIIGRNGAGKTTLLKILCRITEPTTGVARMRGRVGALLEVGTGFHPELTGRENVFLNGAILGMGKAEIRRKFDEIVTFADIERFLDTPVKRYSSGMHMRLAFAVAAHFEPEILIVDEVLAVGDVAFQKKSLGKMDEVAREGRTVVFVSHNLAAVESLCERGVLIDRGRIVEDGHARDVVSRYVRSFGAGSVERVWRDSEKAPGTDTIKLHSARVRPDGGSPLDPITTRTPIVLEFEYSNVEPGAFLNLSLHLFNEQGVLVLNAAPVDEKQWYGRPYPSGVVRDVCRLPGDLLNDGTYRVELLVVKHQSEVVYRDDEILMFEVRDNPDEQGVYGGRWQGVVRPRTDWKTSIEPIEVR